MIALDIDGLEHLNATPAREWLLTHGRLSLDELSRRFSIEGEVRVRIVGDPEMTDLHARTMDIPETTDVLTFDLLEGETEEACAGRIDADIVICADEAARQASERNHGAERELLLYIVHGAMHCVPGYDDVTDEGAAAMHAMEDEILRTIGVGAVFGG